MEHERLTHSIIGRAMTVHDALGPGFLESVYRNALAYELRQAGHTAECELKLQVRYRDVPVGDFVVDMVVDGRVLLELKASRALGPVHEAQIVHYLTATGVDVGLLLNFGADRLEFRRKFRLFRGKDSKVQQL
ncbi:MAG: GxxExxY protein [Gemmatimonadaceae bacterium]